MIGNDIVDLKQAKKDSPDSAWDSKRHQRFLDKVFTKKEQLLIDNSQNQHQMVWLLWSMKEAAYKVNVQQFSKRFFNPKRMECELVTLKKGSVKIDNEIYFATTEITEEYVYTVATLNKEYNYKSECFETKNTNYKTQSNTLKRHLKKALKIEDFKIQKNNIGVPKLFDNNKALDTCFSLTHHGLFSGFVSY